MSLWLESQRATEQRTVLLDFGYTPTALLNNLEVVGADPKKIEALIVSHGHNDHFGGLIGFRDKFRNDLPTDITIYADGQDNFCTRHLRAILKKLGLDTNTALKALHIDAH